MHHLSQCGGKWESAAFGSPASWEQLSPGYVAPVPLQSLLVQESNFWPAFLQEEQNSQIIFCLQADFPKIIERGRV